MKRFSLVLIAAALGCGGCTSLPWVRYPFDQGRVGARGRIDRSYGNTVHMQVMLETKFAHISLYDVSLLGVDGKLLRATSWKDTTPRRSSPPVTIGIGAIGGRRHQADDGDFTNVHHGDEQPRLRTGGGIKFPLGQDDDDDSRRRIRSLDLQWKIPNLLGDPNALRLAVEVANQAPSGKIEITPMILPIQTVAIGGLVKEREERPTTVPALSKIPMLGHLFRDKNRPNKTRETIIFLTPRIVMEE